ncbi:MAG: GNAT family N-acetyltransferase [Alphaproteobacteria bacterium]|jgi:GNAT superfamily N-acetyltransferase|nr:GNAT family N-acetyltransferase [Alphaproteobacteria bacterium]
MISLALLKDHPHHLDELAQWMFELWGTFYPGSTVERVQQWLVKTTQSSDLPITMLALDGPKLVGCAMLQREELYQEKDITPWLGAFLVKDAYQKQGIGSHLHEWALKYTKSLGYKKLYLLALDPSHCEWYKKKGWTIYKTDETGDHPLIVMETLLVQ